MSPTVSADRDPAAAAQAMVDVVSSQSWLTPALAAMDLSQMVTQGLWDSDSILLQLPHVTRDVATRCKESGIEDIFSLIDMRVGPVHGRTMPAAT